MRADAQDGNVLQHRMKAAVENHNSEPSRQTILSLKKKKENMYISCFRQFILINNS